MRGSGSCAAEERRQPRTMWRLTVNHLPTMSLSAKTFRIHRWMGWLIGVQLVIWVTGGVVFSLLPFRPWVKGVDTVKPPTVVLPAGWPARVAPGLDAAAQLGDVTGMAVVGTPQGPALRVNYRGDLKPVIVPIDGMSSNDAFAELYTAFHLTTAARIMDKVTLTRADMISYK